MLIEERELWLCASLSDENEMPSRGLELLICAPSPLTRHLQHPLPSCHKALSCVHHLPSCSVPTPPLALRMLTIRTGLQSHHLHAHQHTRYQSGERSQAGRHGGACGRELPGNAGVGRRCCCCIRCCQRPQLNLALVCCSFCAEPQLEWWWVKEKLLMLHSSREQVPLNIGAGGPRCRESGVRRMDRCFSRWCCHPMTEVLKPV